MGMLKAVADFLRRYSALAFCALSIAQICIGFWACQPLPQENVRLPWHLWVAGGACVFLGLVSCFCACGILALHLAHPKNWGVGWQEDPDQTLDEEYNNRIDMDDVSLACLVPGCLLLFGVAPVCWYCLGLAYEWAEEQPSEPVRLQVQLVLKWIFFMLVAAFALPLLACLVFAGREFRTRKKAT
eukprot:TRINITY_DN21007_c0_g1_i3.p1 TRINITY_DN21007_c0_g1~~TRINITY_DN21007_c0_g1_i3.p1  ORF type:complete len:185 (+),score=43.79 TRINITY_DN21007_c0_g1_i3:347-901(+)